MSGTFNIVNSAMSYVDINAYLDYTASQIKSRASIPDQNAMIVDGSVIHCYKIDTRVVGEILGEGPYASIGTLCASSEVNEWSYFSPREWWDNSGTIESKVKSGVTKDYFAGYHHDAVAPYVISQNGDYYAAFPEQSTIRASIYLGEIDWNASLGSNFIGMDTWSGTSHVGSIVVPIDSVVAGVVDIALSSVQFEFISNQLVESKIYFLEAADDAMTLRVPNIPVLEFNFIAQSITMDFNSTDGIAQKQVFTVITSNPSWSVVTKPDWVTCAVYRGSNYVGNGFYESGDDLWVYPASSNTGLNRIGSIVLSEMVQIDVMQDGGNPTWQYDAASPLVLADTAAYLVVNASTINIAFTVVAGIGNTRSAITFQLYKDGVGFIGDQASKNVIDGNVVNYNLTGFLPLDIENGHSYTIHVDTFA
jgi:hypothetical protein